MALTIQARARELRRNMSPIERILWKRLRYKQMANFRFRRQHPIGPFVVDFYCLEKKIVIELDGPTHGLPAQMRKDPIRERYLKELGLKVLRYTNCQVLTALDAVCEDIFRHLN